VLTSDIDLDSNLPGGRVFAQSVIPSSWGSPFTGSIDGADHVIRNVAVNAPDIVGVGGLINELGWQGTLKNLGLENVAITGTWHVGGLVGYCLSTITRCHSMGVVRGHDSTGGLVGLSEGVIAYCHSTGMVRGDFAVGGLVGYGYTRTTSFSYSSAVVTGTEHVGGLVGVTKGAIVSFCYSTGPVTGDSAVGGLVGANGDLIGCCYSSGCVSGSEKVGGLVGNSPSEGRLEVDCFFLAAADGAVPTMG
jgi:hypothetical protein